MKTTHYLYKPAPPLKARVQPGVECVIGKRQAVSKCDCCTLQLSRHRYCRPFLQHVQ